MSLEWQLFYWTGAISLILLVTTIFLFLIYSNIHFITKLYSEWFWSYRWIKHCLVNKELRTSLTEWAKDNKRAKKKLNLRRKIK